MPHAPDPAPHVADDRPLVVGIGGTTVAGSSTETALEIALDAVAARGARTQLFGHAALAALPHYGPGCAQDGLGAAFVAAVRAADAVVIASPGYHGSISGLVKNALDYLEETARDARPYLHGVPVGLIATAYGWQATGSTLVALRSIVHALRGWPTPFAAAIKTEKGLFVDRRCTDLSIEQQLGLVGEQLMHFLVRPVHGVR